MGKLFDPNRSIDNSYMMRMSQAIAEHRGVFIGMCLGMLFWFALGGFALRNEGVGEDRPLSTSKHGGWTVDDSLFWGAVTGGFITLVGGWSWLHRQMEAENAPAAADEEGIAAAIAQFKEEKQSSAREERIQRLQKKQPPPEVNSNSE